MGKTMINTSNQEWEKQVRDSLKRMEEDTFLKHIFAVEPTVKEIVLRTMNLERKPGYSSRIALEQAQADIKRLVGWGARDKRVAYSNHHHAIMELLRSVVPPDLDGD